MKFGDILNSLIAEQEITQKQLATALNIAASTLSGYVQNVREPDFEMIKVFAGYFNVSTDYLLGYSSQKCVESSHLEDDLLRVFRLLTEEQQQLYLEQGKAILKVNAKKGGLSATPTAKNNAC